jgi:hypothetical protein
MNDTTPEMERLVRERYFTMTPIERFLIGIQMFETARTMALASFPADLAPDEVRRHLCERLYGSLAREAYGKSP